VERAVGIEDVFPREELLVDLLEELDDRDPLDLRPEVIGMGSFALRLLELLLELDLELLELDLPLDLSFSG